MNSIKINFSNRSGITISGRLELPVDGSTNLYAIFAHCFTCSKNLTAVNNLTRELGKLGIGILRFDFTGLGESEGEFENTNFTTNVEDLLDAATYLEENYNAPQLLIGHSLGGAAIIRAAKNIHSVKAVVTIGAPSDPHHVQHLFKDQIEEINKTGAARVSIGGRPFTIKKQFLKDLENYELNYCLKNLDASLLVMHSPHDKIVGIDNARQIYENAVHPKSFISLDGADHLLSRKTDSMYAASVIAAWSSRYLPVDENEAELYTEKQVVTRTGDEGYTTLIRAGHHRFISDEPEAVGGKDLGPTPYDFLLTALGTCTGMTLRMYADRKKWDLQEVRVHLKHDKVHSEDCDHCEKPSSKLDRITREIDIFGKLNKDQMVRLMEIADRCPVHRTLSSDISIITNKGKNDNSNK